MLALKNFYVLDLGLENSLGLGLEKSLGLGLEKFSCPWPWPWP